MFISCNDTKKMSKEQGGMSNEQLAMSNDKRDKSKGVEL
jgi:hypothetical protein